MTGDQESSSSNESLTLASLGVTAPPATSIASPNVPMTPLSPHKDSEGASETLTVCGIPMDPSLIGGTNAPDASSAWELHSSQLASSTPQNSPSTLPRGLQGTRPPAISPSCPRQNRPSNEDESPYLEAAAVRCHPTTEADDIANVRRWKEEIDMLLVFAGLFSGVVTGFLTESTKLFRPEPLAGTEAILEHISAQLERRIPQNTLDLAPPTQAEAGARFAPNRETVQINCLWFVSLILSLGIAFVSILVKWWLQGHSTLSRPVKRVRADPRRGRVQAIMTALPVLLLIALVLFCAGLSILLVTLDMTVGVVAVGMVGFVFVFSAAATVFLSQK